VITFIGYGLVAMTTVLTYPTVCCVSPEVGRGQWRDGGGQGVHAQCYSGRLPAGAAWCPAPTVGQSQGVATGPHHQVQV